MTEADLIERERLAQVIAAGFFGSEQRAGELFAQRRYGRGPMDNYRRAADAVIAAGYTRPSQPQEATRG